MINPTNKHRSWVNIYKTIITFYSFYFIYFLLFIVNFLVVIKRFFIIINTFVQTSAQFSCSYSFLNLVWFQCYNISYLCLKLRKVYDFFRLNYLFKKGNLVSLVGSIRFIYFSSRFKFMAETIASALCDDVLNALIQYDKRHRSQSIGSLILMGIFYDFITFLDLFYVFG